VTPARTPTSRLPVFLWMRISASLFVLGLGFVDATPAVAERTLVAAPVVGIRSFESKLDLEDEAAIGFRLGMTTGDRVTVLVDYLHTAPVRTATGQRSHITGLRTLAEINVLTGSVRPYVLAGFGGVLFDFADANDTGSAAGTIGLGLGFKPWHRTSLFLEGSLDFYRSQEVIFSPTGSALFLGPRSTDQITTLEAGAALEF